MSPITSEAVTCVLTARGSLLGSHGDDGDTQSPAFHVSNQDLRPPGPVFLLARTRAPPGHVSGQETSLFSVLVGGHQGVHAGACRASGKVENLFLYKCNFILYRGAAGGRGLLGFCFGAGARLRPRFSLRSPVSHLAPAWPPRAPGSKDDVSGGNVGETRTFHSAVPPPRLSAVGCGRGRLYLLYGARASVAKCCPRPTVTILCRRPSLGGSCGLSRYRFTPRCQPTRVCRASRRLACSSPSSLWLRSGASGSCPRLPVSP